MLLGVDGIGPKVALSVLSTLTWTRSNAAVFTEEPDILSRVPGVAGRHLRSHPVFGMTPQAHRCVGKNRGVIGLKIAKVLAG